MIGENIATRREQQNMTQKELAEKVHVQQSMICQIERGTKSATVQLAMQIADALGCGLSDLIAERAE